MLSDVASHFEEHRDRFSVPGLRGLGVTQIRIDYQFTLLAGSYQVILEQPFAYRCAGVFYQVVPETRQGVGNALALFGTVFRSIDAMKTGHLRIEFADDSRLDVEPDAQYEAWQIGTGGSGLIVAQPGGELAVWY